MARLASARALRVEAGIHAFMSYVTYILLSKAANKTYVGYTNDFVRRLKEHNQGKSTFTKRYIPWVVLYNENYLLELDAIKREKYLKSAAGRRWIKKNLFNLPKW